MKKLQFLIILFIVSTAFGQNSIVKQFSQAFANVAEKANPAVVTVSSETVQNLSDVHQNFPFEGFGVFPPGGPKEFRGHGLGSGVIVDQKNGYIITNNHVIENAEEIKITLLDKRVIIATVIGTDPKSDLAVLQIDADNLTSVKLGNSDALRVGEWVMAIGSPFSENLSHTVTTGIVSALSRSNIINSANYENFIQTDAAINPGNSGGALLNMDGELIGINTALATGGRERGNQGVGFAIPSNMVRKVMDDIIEKGYVIRSWLGVFIQEVDHKVAKALELDTRDGALVSKVIEDSPAEKGGLLEGDVIIAFNGVHISDLSHLRNVVSSTPPGERSKVEIYRDGKKRSLKITIEELPKEGVPVFSNVPASDDNFGLTVQDVSQYTREKFNIDPDKEGVVVTEVRKNSVAYDAGIKPGDIITRVGTKSISSKSQFNELMNDQLKDNTLLLLVKRDNRSRFYALEKDG